MSMIHNVQSFEESQTLDFVRLDYKKRRNQLLDFIENFKVGCASIGAIMTERRGKTKAERTEEIGESILKWQQKADSLKDGLKSKQTVIEKINILNFQLKEIEDYEETAKDVLSETAKNYCLEKLSNFIFEKSKKELKTTSILKGKLVESEGITLIGEFYEDLPFCFKHEGNFENKWIRGECDILTSEMVIDHKASVEHKTFPLFAAEIPDEQYHWQVQGYMWGYNRLKASVIYTLLDMPEQLIFDKAKFELGWGYTKSQYEQYRMEFIYSHLPIEDRIRRWDFDRNENMIQQIAPRVELCKQFILQISQERGWI